MTVSDKISIINAMMAEDRTEIRERQEAVFRLTYIVFPGLIAIAAFAVDKPALRPMLILGQALLLVVYAIAFRAFRHWLADARACLEIRESFYKNPSLLARDHFDPLTLKQEHRDALTMRDTHLWFPFFVTAASGVVLLAYMLVVWSWG
jgi:hypothetical protein